MARSLTLQQLIDQVADRIDVAVSASVSARHTTSAVVSRLNRAIQKWKVMVMEAGDDADLITVRTATSASQTRDGNNWAPYQYIAQPAKLMKLRGIDIWPVSTRPVAMMPADELERDDSFRLSGWWNQGGTGMPVFYRLGGNAVSGPIIQIFPWANAVYTVDLRYIPSWTDLSASLDLGTSVDFILGGDEWVVNDAIIQTGFRDGPGMVGLINQFRQQNEQIKRDMMFSLACRAPAQKVDTRARRKELLAWANPSLRIP